jgi:O-antigen/teichoic acid export membrane protein
LTARLRALVASVLARLGNPGGLGRELASASATGAILRVAEIGLGVASLTILARALGPMGLGIYAIAMATNSLIGIPAKAGLPSLVVREVAVAHQNEAWGRMRGVLLFSTLMVLSTSIVLSAVTLAGLKLFGPAEWSSHLETQAWALALIPIMAFGNVRGAALLALRRPILGQLPELLIRPGLYLALLIGAALLEPGWLTPARAVILQIIASVAAFVTGAALLYRAVPPEAHKAKPVTAVRAWLTSALSFSMTAGLRAAQPSLAVLMLGALGSTEAAGIFRLAQRGADLVAFGASTITRVIGPHLARLHASQAKVQLQKLATRAAQASTLAAVAVMLLYVVAGPRGLSWLFGESFEQSFIPILILSGAQTISAFFGVNTVLMNMARRERVVTASFAAGLTTQIALSFLLISRFGIEGAALSVAASFLVWNTILWWAARRYLGIRTTAAGI